MRCVQDSLWYAVLQFIVSTTHAADASPWHLCRGARIEKGLVSLQDRVYLADDYKRQVLEHMSIPQLIETIMINPTVHISPSYRDTGLSASYTFQPLSNLVYTRDQQITTANGIVMGRLRSTQRQLEVDLMQFCFQKLGETLLAAEHAPRCWWPPVFQLSGELVHGSSTLVCIES